MDETLTMLADSVQRLLADTVSHRSTIDAERDGLDDNAWRQLAALGVVGDDAAQMSLAELGVVIEAVGAAGALLPYADSEALGRWLAHGAGIDSGSRRLAVLPVEAGQASLRDGGARLQIGGATIPWGCRADALLFSLHADGRDLVAIKDARDIELRRMPSLAGEPHGVVVAESIEIGAGELHEVDAAHGPDALRRRGALCRSIQMLGAMSRANELTLQYARERKQFRRSLSDFQVIQSYLAAMAGELCAAAGIVQVAIDSADDAPDEAFEAIAAARVRSCQAARQITQLAHQVHGAIGFTQEYPLNLWTRRLWAWREEYGNEAQWATELGASVVHHGADALWPQLTAQTEAARG